MLVKVFEGVWVHCYRVCAVAVEKVEDVWVVKVLYSCGDQHVESLSDGFDRFGSAAAEMDRIAALINKGA